MCLIDRGMSDVENCVVPEKIRKHLEFLKQEMVNGAGANHSKIIDDYLDPVREVFVDLDVPDYCYRYMNAQGNVLELKMKAGERRLFVVN